MEEDDFITLQSSDVAELRTRLVEILNGVQTAPLARLAQGFLNDEEFMDKFCRAPAGMKNHHAYQGGLLEHVVSLLELVLAIGAALSATQYATSCCWACCCTTRRRSTNWLVRPRHRLHRYRANSSGHMVMGVTMLDDKVRQIVQQDGMPFPDRLVAGAEST